MALTITVEGINQIEVNFDEQIRGTTFKGASYTLTDGTTGNPIDLTDAAISIWWRFGNVKGKIVRRSDETDGITITDATAGKFQIDSFDFEDSIFKPGHQYYDIKFVIGTETDTYFYGYINILENSTE